MHHNRVGLRGGFNQFKGLQATEMGFVSAALYLCICDDCSDFYLRDSCTWLGEVIKFMRITSASWDDQ